MSTPLPDHIALIDELQFAVREYFCGNSGFSRVHVARAAILAALAQPAIAGPCLHRPADARNPIVKSGYICINCGALFSAADHYEQPTPAASPARQMAGELNHHEWLKQVAFFAQMVTSYPGFDDDRGAQIAKPMLVWARTIEAQADELRARLESQGMQPVEASPEPVAFVNGDELDDLPDGRAVLIQSDKDGWRGTPLYKEPPVVLCPSCSHSSSATRKTELTDAQINTAIAAWFNISESNSNEFQARMRRAINAAFAA